MCVLGLVEGMEMCGVVGEKGSGMIFEILVPGSLSLNSRPH